MTIIYNTNYTHNPNAYLTLGIKQAAQRLFGSENIVVADNRSLMAEAASGRHSCLICIDGQRLRREIIERIRPAFQHCILWLFEDPFMLEFNLANVDLFDYVFTNDLGSAAAYGNKGHYLPLAGATDLQFRPILDDNALEYDIFFAGTMWPNRVQTIQALLNRFPDKRFKLVCPTNVYLPPLPRDIAARAIQWPINHQSFVDFANASRVTLTMFRDYASHGDVGKATSPGPRLFELGLAGTAQIVELDSGIDRRSFDVVNGVACTDNLEALISEVGAVLADPRVRKSRAEASQRSVSTEHLYENRLKRIADVTHANFGRKENYFMAPTAQHQKRKLRVLMCTHSTIHRQAWGGVEVYQELLSKALAQSVETFYWLRQDTRCMLTDARGVVLEQYEVEEIGWLDSLCDPGEEGAFSRIITLYGIDIVHFQHLGHHTASLPLIAKACGVGTVFSAHDFFLVCSRYNLLDQSLNYCDINHGTITKCDICLRRSEGVSPGGQQARRAFMNEVIQSVDVFLFGTHHSEAVTTDIYPALASKRREVLGIPAPSLPYTVPPPRQRRAPDTPLKVAVVGNFLRTKGADAVLAVLEMADPNRYEFHLLGKAEAQYDGELERLKRPSLKYYGRYDLGNLGVLEDCDVALFLSIWPETYCITLSEAWQRRIIPIVTDIGAIGERVTHGTNGFKVAINDPAVVLGYLETLRTCPDRLLAMQEAITPALWVDTEKYFQDIKGIYESLRPEASFTRSEIVLDIGQLHLLEHRNWRKLAPPRHIFDPSHRSNFSVEFPDGIDAWEAREATFYIESLCGILIADIAEGNFKPTNTFQVGGWGFLNKVGISGEVFLVLNCVDEDRRIVFKTEREFRPDVGTLFASAPRQAGFRTEAAFYGKWAEGRYRLAIGFRFDNKATLVETPYLFTVADGAIADISVNEVFFAKDIKLSTTHTVRYCIENVNAEGDRSAEVKLGAITPTTSMFLRGWSFAEPVEDKVSVVCLGLVRDGHGLKGLTRTTAAQRQDVRNAFPGAPLTCGFEGEIRPPKDLADGKWQAVLCQVVGQSAVVEVTRLVFGVRDGKFETIEVGDPTPTQREAASAFFSGK